MKWHLTHLPSLHSVVESNQIVFVSKDLKDHTKIVALVYSVVDCAQQILMTLEIGSNEDQYLTDCVFCSAGPQQWFFALNKRTKASEPFVSEVVVFSDVTKST